MNRGSSPLARGALWRSPSRVTLPWIIPARAGSTRTGRARLRPSGDHPRSRGEHGSPYRRLVTALGSSPLARGARRRGHRRLPGSGIIPARAGSTPCRSRWSCRSRDHPRSRGEHTFKYGPHKDGVGSSPLARGAHERGGLTDAGEGIIPARAGSRARASRPFRVWRDHPRSRGEHVPIAFDGMSVLGSSPLARGAQERVLVGDLDVGIIPARAGSTSPWCPPRARWWDHPRSRGEHAYFLAVTRSPPGSSPLARGARTPLSAFRARRGIIPARAGSTSRMRPRRSGSRDHPRSRGEHSVTVMYADTCVGSSPLARGAHRRSPHRPEAGGIIPARAGSTPSDQEIIS